MIGKAVKLAAQGKYTGAVYRIRKLFNVAQYPTFLVYQFTNNCNSRCQMCNIWKKESKGELTTDDIKKALKKPVFKKLRWVNLTGGEPFLRADIVDVCEAFANLPKLEGIAIPSNGFLTKRVEDAVKEILKVLRNDQFLSITLSIDGFEKTHDEIRGVPGAYKNVTATLDRLSKLKTQNPNFNVGVQPTISKKNLPEIEKFYKEMKKKTGSVGFAVMMTSEGFYSNTESEIALNKEDKKKVAKFLNKTLVHDPQYGFYYSKLVELFNTGKRNFGCLAGYLTLYMDPFGNLSPCPVLCSGKYLFGNVKDKGVWFNEKGRKIRAMLKKEPVCKTCSMMCDFINVAKVEFYEHALWMMMHPKIMARLAKKISKDKNPYF